MGMSGEKREQKIGASTRTAVWATVGVTAILGVALLFALLAAPILHTRAVIISAHEKHCARQAGWDSFDPFLSGKDVMKVLERLGGPARALPRLKTYMRLPGWMAPRKICAIQTLGH